MATTLDNTGVTVDGLSQVRVVHLGPNHVRLHLGALRFDLEDQAARDFYEAVTSLTVPAQLSLTRTAL